MVIGVWVNDMTDTHRKIHAEITHVPLNALTTFCVATAKFAKLRKATLIKKIVLNGYVLFQYVMLAAVNLFHRFCINDRCKFQ